MLLHGGGGSSALLAGSADAPGYTDVLTPRFHVIAPDRRGHGRTVHPGGPLTYQAIAADHIGLCSALGIERAVFWGATDGANVALEIARQKPGLVVALVLWCALPLVTETYTQRMTSVLRVEKLDEPLDPEAIARLDPEFITALNGLHDHQGPDSAQRYLRLVQPLWARLLGYGQSEFDAIDVPVLVGIGDRDVSYSVEDTVAFFRRLPRAELAVMPGASHGQPRLLPEFVAIAEDFIERNLS